MKFSQDIFNQFIIENDIIKIFDTPIQLKSGKQSHVYINWRQVASDPFLMNRLTDFVIHFSHRITRDIDTFFGVPEGATPLGLLTQFKYAQMHDYSKGSHALSIGRAKPKEHGDPSDRYFIGKPNGVTAVLEDVTTTGGSLISCIEQLKACNVNAPIAIGLTNREHPSSSQSIKKTLHDLSVSYYAMSTATELIQTLLDTNPPSTKIKDAIKKEYQL